jgi:hypothetical protein
MTEIGVTACNQGSVGAIEERLKDKRWIDPRTTHKANDPDLGGISYSDRAG